MLASAISPMAAPNFAQEPGRNRDARWPSDLRSSRPIRQSGSLCSIFRALTSILVPTERPGPASTPTPTSASSGSPAGSCTLGLLFRWRPNKGEVQRDGLIEKFCAVQSFNRGLGFWLSGVFDQGISLYDQAHEYIALWKMVHLSGTRP